MKKIVLFVFITAIASISWTKKSFPIYTKSDLMGKIDPAKHQDFVKVGSRYSNKTIFVREATYASFKKMAKAASKDGINLVIVSGTRNQQRQVEIWSSKWERFSGEDSAKAEEILLYSSMPGTSRHHWGTDIDLNSVEPAYFESGKGAEIYAWLANNAEDYGFFQPYILKGEERKEGYREEKWHWSYYPIADPMLRAYKRLVSYEDLQGFPGAELAPKLNVFYRFVQGVPDLNAKHNGFYSPKFIAN